MTTSHWIQHLHSAAVLAELSGYKHLAAAYRAMIAREIPPK